MQSFFKKLFSQHTLSRSEAKNALIELTSEGCSDSARAAFLTVFNMRPVTANEILGFRDAMIDLSLKPTIDSSGSMDICGTGGDGKNTFNISTTAAFIVAGAEQKIIKHGNYAVSSKCGSSNVLEGLGVRLTDDNKELNRQLSEANLCFLHAPLFHPALKTSAPTRKALGFKTIFNILGPLANPALPKIQCSGVYSYDLVSLYRQVLSELEIQFGIVYALDGFDECSLTGKCLLTSWKGEEVFSAIDLGLGAVQQDQIRGADDVKTSAEILFGILKGEGSQSHNAVAIANAGIALFIADRVSSLKEGVQAARNSLTSGKALAALNTCIGEK